jgi:putative transposase
MDFVSDSLFEGRRLRALTIVDNFTRESLAVAVEQGIKGSRSRRFWNGSWPIS